MKPLDNLLGGQPIVLQHPVELVIVERLSTEGSLQVPDDL
jgi:hypothetical protein